MAQDKKDNRIKFEDDAARSALLEGAKFIADAVGTTYGPKGQNVLLEKPFGRPLLTRDGVTVARDAYLSKREANMGAQMLLEASETTNRIGGDGTSATVVLGYNLMKHGNQAIAAGTHPMDVKATLLQDRNTLLDELGKISKPTKKGQLKDVATVSSGDALLGQLIAEAVEYVGPDGGIITEKAYVQEVEREYVDGYYLQGGFEALQSGKKELISPYVIVSSRRIASIQDIAELMNKAAAAIEINLESGEIPRFLFIGNFEDAAYNTVVNTVNQARLDAVIIKTPPVFANMGKQLLEDIAAYAGCDLIDDTTNLKEFSARYIGQINKVIAGKTEATLFADNKTELVQDRIVNIKSQLEDEISDAVAEKLRDRIAKLEGKIALFRIGGATDTTKEETEFRVEDAIHATRAASTDGVVPGGGSTLLYLASPSVSDIARKALLDTFKLLMTNAGLAADVMVNELMVQPQGWGFNLRASDEAVDLVKAGILDPTLVVEQVITNAISAASDALTVGTLLTFEDKED